MTYNEYNDDEIIYMIRESDSDDALSFILKKYEPLFKKISLDVIKRNRYKGLDLDDLMQQCRIATCKALEKYDNSNETLFYTYLVVCLKRSLSGYVRNALNKPDVYYYMEDEANFFNTISNNEDVFKNIEMDDFYTIIHSFSLDLKFIDSCVFELRISNFSYKEISKLLDISLKQVDNSLLKTRKKLEKFLRNSY